MNNVHNKLSPSLTRNLYQPGHREVIITQQCRQLRQKLLGKGLEAKPLPLIDAVAVTASNRSVARLCTRPDVKYIEDDRHVTGLMDRARQTIGLDAAVIRASESLSHVRATGKGVTIAFIDTGIFPHPDFEGRIRAFVDMMHGKKEAYDDHGHGTMCAGCAAGSGLSSGGRYRGVAPEAGIVAVKGMDGHGGGSLLSVLFAMQWVSDKRMEYGIRVLSLSLGVETNEKTDALMRASEALWTQGIVVVTAAGNSGPRPGTINSPGKARSVVTVGAINDRSDNYYIPDFSSRGPVAGAIKPELYAPGVDLTTTRRAGYGLFTGTSAAAPIVAGCAALLLERHPDWTPDMVKKHMLATAAEPDGLITGGYGVVRADSNAYLNTAAYSRA